MTPSVKSSVVVATVVLLGLTACGGGDAEDGTVAGEDAAAPETSAEEVEPEPTTQGETSTEVMSDDESSEEEALDEGSMEGELEESNGILLTYTNLPGGGELTPSLAEGANGTLEVTVATVNERDELGWNRVYFHCGGMSEASSVVPEGEPVGGGLGDTNMDELEPLVGLSRIGFEMDGELAPGPNPVNLSYSGEGMAFKEKGDLVVADDLQSGIFEGESSVSGPFSIEYACL